MGHQRYGQGWEGGNRVFEARRVNRVGYGEPSSSPSTGVTESEKEWDPGESPGSFILEAHLYLPPPSLPLITFRPPSLRLRSRSQVVLRLDPKRPGPQHLGQLAQRGLVPQLGQASSMPAAHRLPLRRCVGARAWPGASELGTPAPGALGFAGATGCAVMPSARLHSPAGKGGGGANSKVYPQISGGTNGSLVRKRRERLLLRATNQGS